MQIKPLTFLIALCSFMTACGGGSGYSAPASASTSPSVLCPSSASTGSSLDLERGTFLAVDFIHSNTIGYTYPICVYLPPGYADSTLSYPVLYHTDGELIAASATRLERLRKQVIIIGIGGLDRRGTDLVRPGSTNYYQFIIHDVMPAVEAKYRIDKSNRSLAGHSLGGLFVVVAALMDTPTMPLFSNYLSSDGSFWEEAIDLNARYSQNPALHAKLVMVGADSGGNGVYVGSMASALKARNFVGLDLQYLDSPADTHFSAEATSDLLAFPEFFPNGVAPYGNQVVTLQDGTSNTQLTYYGTNTYWAVVDLEAGEHNFTLAADVEYGAAATNATLVAGARTALTLNLNKAGTYVFKVDATHPGSPVLTAAERVSQFAAQPIYLSGDMNNWGFANRLIPSDGNTYVSDIALGSGTHEFKVASDDWIKIDYGSIGVQQAVTLGSSNVLDMRGVNLSIVVSAPATYRFTLTVKDGYAPTMTVTKL